MLRQATIYGVLAGAALALEACTTLPVTTDVNPNYSVTNCHTYAFAREHVANADQPAAFGNPLNADRVRAAIESNLAARGIQRVNDPAAANCIIGYAIGTRQVFQDYYGWGAGGYWGYGWGYGGYYGWGPGGPWGWDGPWVTNETRIVVDVFDAQSHKAMWHGAVSQSVSDLTGPNAAAKINTGTAAIFSKFPVAPRPAAAPLPAASAPAAAPPAAGEQPRTFMYPKNGQSEQQQATDWRECQQWASQNGVAANSPDYHRALVACLDGRGYSVN
jgi:Domain of unknown function (DUF4136)